MKEKYLPIGTVCLLKNATKKIMITGFCGRPAEQPDTLFDYLGCPFPEGIIASDINILFNHDQIQNVIFEGLNNEETMKFNKLLIEAIDNSSGSVSNESQQSVNVEKSNSIDKLSHLESGEDLKIGNSVVEDFLSSVDE